jgi:bifunctional ADP-heptose synthase (sugar kinase/adenylyltransferase)
MIGRRPVDGVGKIVPLAHIEGIGGILCMGCYDLCHIGHLRYFQWARGLATGPLTAALTGDYYFSRRKGENRPAFPESVRAEWLSYIALLDFIAIVYEPTGVAAINTIRPAVYAKGWEPQGVIAEEIAATEKHGGIVRIAKEGECGQTYSSSKILSGEYLKSRPSARRPRGIGEGDVGVE